jgi:hypothetical protein
MATFKRTLPGGRNLPGFLLRLEALVALAVGCIAYARLFPGHWGLFAVLFLTPDVSLLPYLVSNGSLSAACYNAVHTYVLPLGLGLIAFEGHWPIGMQLTLIWLSHISFDRALGYGLKFPGSFRYTHMQSATIPSGSLL